jgi:DIM1 family U5 snRNP protein
MLPHLHSGYAVDQAILAEQNRLVVIRFGHDWDPECMSQDECLSSIANKMKNMAVIYVVRNA